MLPDGSISVPHLKCVMLQCKSLWLQRIADCSEATSALDTATERDIMSSLEVTSISEPQCKCRNASLLLFEETSQRQSVCMATDII